MGSDDDCCVGMGKFLAFLSVVTFLLHAAGMANPYWLSKEFSLLASPTPGTPLVEVESSLGPLWGCTDQKSTALNIDKYECESLTEIDEDLLEDWQWVVAGMGIGSVVFSLLGLVLSISIACMSGRNMGYRAATIFCYFIACCLLTAALVLLHENKDILVLANPVKIRQDYGLEWGFYVAAVGAGMLLVMSLLHMFVACGANGSNTVV